MSESLSFKEARRDLFRAIEFVDANNFKDAMDVVSGDTHVPPNAVSAATMRCILSLVSLGLQAPNQESYVLALDEILPLAQELIDSLKQDQGHV